MVAGLVFQQHWLIVCPSCVTQCSPFLTFSHPAELQLEGFVLHFIMNYVDATRTHTHTHKHKLVFTQEDWVGEKTIAHKGWSKMKAGLLTFWRPPWPALCTSSPSSETQTHTVTWADSNELCLFSNDLSSPAASRSPSLQPVLLYQWHNPSNPGDTHAHTNTLTVWQPKPTLLAWQF